MRENLLTVNQLIKDLKKLSKNGYGKANILLSSDDEATNIDQDLIDWFNFCGNESYASEIKNNPTSYIVLG